jgi:hypothetical protein
VKEITYSLSGAQTGQETVPGEQARFTVTGEGATAVRFFAVDQVGNREEPPKSVEVKLDKTPPVMALVLDPQPNAAGWHRTDVRVTMQGSDGVGSGVKEVRYALSGAQSRGEVVVPGATAAFVVTEEGSTTATFFAVDVADNAQSPATLDVRIDKTAPRTIATVARAEGSSSPTDLRVTLRAADEGGSGVREIRYRLSGAQPGEGVIPGAEGSFVVSAAGTTTVTFYATDIADNREADQVIEVRSDSGAPVTSAAFDPPPNAAGWNRTHVQVTLTAVDPEGSAVAEIRYRIDGGSEVVVPGGRATFSIAKEGVSTLAFFAIDGAGNREGEKSEVVRIDRKAPATSVGLAPPANAAGWNRTDVVVTLDATDEASGVQEIRYSLAGAETGERVVMGDHASFTLAAEGTTTVAAFAVDVAGNQEAATSVPVKIDRTPPQISFVGNAGTYTFDQEVDIRVQVTDALSGVASTDARDVRGPAYSFMIGPNVVNATAVDVAGNTASQSTTFTVRFTFDGIRALLRRFVQDSGQLNALTRIIDNIEEAIASRNASARRNQIESLIATIDNRRGGALTSEQADLLMRLLRTL